MYVYVCTCHASVYNVDLLYFYYSLICRYNDGFTCPNCGTEPKTVIMDATSLAFRKQLDSWESLFQTPPKIEERTGR